MTLRLSALLSATSALSLGAQTLTIDNFSSGNLVTATDVPGPHIYIQTGPNESIIGGIRTVEVDNPSRIIVLINANGFRFQELRAYSDNGPLPQTKFSLSYGDETLPLGIDLSHAHSLAVQIADVLPGSPTFEHPDFGIQWIIASGASEISVSPIQSFQYLPFPLPGDLYFPLADFSPAPGMTSADLSSIQSLQLAVSLPDSYSSNPLIPPALNRLRISGLTALFPIPESSPSSTVLICGLGLIWFRSRWR